MSNDTKNMNAEAADEQLLAQLFKLAGERAEIPIGIESRVRHRVQEEWRVSTTQPNSDEVYAAVRNTWKRGTLWNSILRWTLPIGATAAAVVAVSIVSPPETVPVVVAATVSRVTGSGAASTEFPAGADVHAGDTIATGPNEGVSLLLARSESLRIDANTRLRVEAKDRFTLLSGRIYADSGQFVYRDGGLTIDTEFGVVTDVGTQFSVASGERTLDVAVREGRVDIKNQSDTYVAMMGERLTIVQGQRVVVAAIESHDDYWSWVAELTPDFDMKNKSLLDFLSWAARETGRELRFETAASRMSAMRTDVAGSVTGLTPQEALRAVLATTTVSYRIESDRIIID